MEVSKSKVEKYTIKIPGRDTVEVIMEDWELGRSGQIIIKCWDKAFSTSWGSMGDTIKDFICRIDNGYLIKNLDGYPYVYDPYKTKEIILKDILAERCLIGGRTQTAKKLTGRTYRMTDLDEKALRDAYDSALDWYFDDFNTPEGFINAANRSHSFWMAMYDDPPCPPVCTTNDPWLESFIENEWHKFKEFLRNEKIAGN